MTTMLAPPSLLLPDAATDRGSQHRQQHQDNDTVNLLHFIDMASSNIKLALDRPSKSKRKVNHRKYLQKQLKRCNGQSGKRSSGETTRRDGQTAGSGQPASGASSSARCCRKMTSQIGLQIKSLQALFDPRTLYDKCWSDSGAGVAVGGGVPVSAGKPSAVVVGGTNKAPLRSRNLPPSFFVEPALRDSNALSAPAVGSTLEVRGQAQLQKLPSHVPAHPVYPFLDSGVEHGRCSAPFPALPADTLESILGQADLSELLAGRWQQARDSNHTPCEGSVGTSSPRSFSDSSDAYCTSSSPGPSSTHSRSPSWSPCLPSLPHVTHLASRLEEGLVGRHGDTGAGYFLPTCSGVTSYADSLHHHQHPQQEHHQHQQQPQQERLSHLVPFQPQVVMQQQQQQPLQSLPLHPLQQHHYHQQQPQQQKQQEHKLSVQDVSISTDSIFRGGFDSPTSGYYHDLAQHNHQQVLPSQQQQHSFVDAHELLAFSQPFPCSDPGQGYNSSDFGSWQNVQPDAFFPYLP